MDNPPNHEQLNTSWEPDHLYEKWNISILNYRHPMSEWTWMFDVIDSNAKAINDDMLNYINDTVSSIDRELLLPKEFYIEDLRHINKWKFVQFSNTIPIYKGKNGLAEALNKIRRLCNSEKYIDEYVLWSIYCYGLTKLTLCSKEKSEVEFIYPQNKEQPYILAIRYKYHKLHDDTKYIIIELQSRCDIWFTKNIFGDDNLINAEKNGPKLRQLIKSISNSINKKPFITACGSDYFELDENGPII